MAKRNKSAVRSLKEVKPESVSVIAISELFNNFGYSEEEKEILLQEGQLNHDVTWGDTDMALLTFENLSHIMSKGCDPEEKKFHVDLIAYALKFETKDLFVDLAN